MFDVVVPTYNNLDELICCLRGLEVQTLQDFRVFVCVDGSTDNTLDYLANHQFSFQMVVLTHPDNRHQGRNPARNLVLPHLQSKYVLFMDSDIVPAQSLLASHIKLLNDCDCVSIGRVVYRDRKNNILADYIQQRGVNKFRDRAKIPSQYFITQNVALKSRYFIQLGGQDTAFVGYGGDDIELGVRLEKMFQIPFLYNPSAVGTTRLNKTLVGVLDQMREFGAVNLHLLRDKYPEMKAVFRLDLVDSNTFKGRLIRLFIVQCWADLAMAAVYHVPGWLGRKLIHFLFFYHMAQGYRQGK